MNKLVNFFYGYDLKKGIILCLLAWLCFSSMYVISKLIGDSTNIATMVFFRNVVGLIAVLPWIAKNLPNSVKVKNIKLITVRSFMGILNLLFIFLALQKISLVNTTLLNNTAPLIVPLIVFFWLRTPLKLKIWPAILVGFIGVALILQPTKMILNEGALYGLLSGICLAVSLVTMRVSSRHESFYTFLFYFFGIGLVLTLPFAIWDWKIDNALTLLGLLGLGFFSAVGQVCLFNGLKLGQARQLAPVAYSAVVFAGIYEWLIWGVVPKPIFYIGMVLIIASGIWIVFESRRPKGLSK